jgi:hypothetical protein
MNTFYRVITTSMGPPPCESEERDTQERIHQLTQEEGNR